MQNEQGRARPGFEVVVVFQTRHEPGVVPAAETECPDKEVGGRNIPQRQQIAEPLVFPVSPRPSQRSNGLACDQAGQDRGQSDRQHQRGCAAQSIDQPVTQEIQRGNQRDEYGDLDDRTSMEIHVATFLWASTLHFRGHADRMRSWNIRANRAEVTFWSAPSRAKRQLYLSGAQVTAHINDPVGNRSNYPTFDSSTIGAPIGAGPS